MQRIIIELVYKLDLNTPFSTGPSRPLGYDKLLTPQKESVIGTKKKGNDWTLRITISGLPNT